MPGLYYPQCRATLKVVFDGFGGADSDPVVIQVMPRSVGVHLNGYRQADTFDMEFDAHAFPFSPELIRNAAVEIFLFQTDGFVADVESFAHEKNKDGTLRNLVISGLIDDAALHSGADGSFYSVSGRDYTALLLDKEFPQHVLMDPGETVDATVKKMVDTAVGARLHGGSTLQVRFISGGEIPKTGDLPKTTTQAKEVTKPITAHRHGKTNKRGIPVRSGKNFWDVIYSLCLQHGLICFVKGNEVLISKPSILTQESANRVRYVAYGRNLSDLHIERHMGHEQVPQIVVTSYNDDARHDSRLKKL